MQIYFLRLRSLFLRERKMKGGGERDIRKEIGSSC